VQTIDKVRIEGPDVLVTPRTALGLTMAMNELATNAAKYGALSDSSGSLSVSWGILAPPGGDAMLEILWEERCRKPVQAPTRRGFGTRLIERCIEGDLEGGLDMKFNASGLRCRITIPMRVPATA
jgi:two-component sensor histidine kinase